jgi:sialic acid synthase SpsE
MELILVIDGLFRISMTFFISEISSNHSRNIERCLKFVDVSTDIGADAIKFQLFEIEKLFSDDAIKFKPELLDRKKWELPKEFIPDIKKYCEKKKIQFGCTPFYIEAVDFLYKYVDFYKIASYELLWDDLLISCARTKKPVIISTGMSNLDEIKHAVNILRQNNCEPSVLHCVSSYPALFREANLSAIKTIRSALKCDVGWSDHTVSPGVVHRAIHKWDAKIIEFHLDLDGDGVEFAKGHCWLPEKIKEIIKNVKDAVDADGDGNKKPTPSEVFERKWRADPEDGLRPLKSTRKLFC